MSDTTPSSALAAPVIPKIRATLCVDPGIKLVILYGSVARGKERHSSDVDLAVLYDHPLSADEKMRIMEELGQALGREVDLVDLFSLNGTLLRKVLCGGKVLHRDGSGSLARLLQRMIYNQTDMMPYTIRALKERQHAFVHG